MSIQVGMVTSSLDHGLSGPNRVLLNICEELDRRDLSGLEITFVHNSKSDFSIYSSFSEVILPRTPLRFERSLAKLDFDIVYYPHFPKMRPGFFYLDAKKVVHLHGDLPYAYPSLMSARSRYKQYALAAVYRWTGLSRRVDTFLAASDSLIQNKMQELGLQEERFVQIPYAPAISTRRSSSEDITTTIRRLNIRDSYMLDVASQSNRKNIRNLVDAVSLLHDQGSDPPQLVIAGDWKGTAVYQYGLNQLADDVVFTGYIEDSTLADLYNGAELYVNPTRHEAFGLTNLEAMAAGLPIVTSNQFAVPEVVGDAALLVEDPEDVFEIAEKIRFLLDCPKERRQLATKALERSEKFTWEGTVDDILDVFGDLG